MQELKTKQGIRLSSTRWSIIGLLATVVLLFGFQGHIILDRPVLIALIAEL
mgnify:CR=1 FL=1